MRPLDILLVEDDELVRLCLHEALEEAGLTVTDRASAEAALDVVEIEGAPCVLVTDINLGPGMDGLAFAGGLRRRFPSLRVVYISGRHQALAKLDGRERFLPKPFRADLLLRTISEVRASAS